MARTLMDMIGFGSAGSTPPPVNRPTVPLPAVPERKWNKNAGIIGNLLGIGDNEFYQASRPMIQDLGYGMSQGKNWQEGLSIAARHGAMMAPDRKKAAELEENRLKYAELVGGWGEEYQPFAAGIAEGAIDPGVGYFKALEFKSERDKEGETRSRSAANAQFLNDPELRSMVEGGALDFETAYKYQTNGGVDPRTISTQPLWAKDEAGQPVLGQLSNDGSFVPTDMGGLQPMAPYDINSQRAAGTANGRTQAGAEAALPTAVADAQRVGMQIEDLKSHPGLDEIFGKTLGVIPNQWGPTVPGTKKADAMARIEQMSGNAFLSGRTLLKGGGAITDFESKKAEAAFARLSTAQSKEEFLLGLDEFQQAMDSGVAKLQAQTGGGADQPSNGTFATNPATGERLELVNGQWVQAQ